MSFNLGEASGRIVLETDFSSLAEGSAALAQLQDQAGAAASTVNSRGEAIKKSFNGAANASLVAGSSIAAGFAYAVKSASDFEFTMSGIQAVSGASAAQMAQISKAALRIGADTTFSADQAGQAFAELIKAGVSVENALGGAADATVALAAAGGIDLPEAAAIASNAMNQFNLAAKDLPGVADTIAGAANASAIDVTDFAQSLSQVGAVANLAGASFEDTATAIALMGNAGIKGSDAGTSLKGVLMNLNPSTKEATELMKELGLITADGSNQFYDAQGNMKSLASVSQTLQKALAGQTAQQKQAALTTLFGSDAIRGAAILAGQGADGFNKMADAMGKVSAADVAAARMSNLQGSIEAFTGSIETAAILIGTPLLRAVTTIVDTLNNAVAGFAQLSSGAQATISIIAGVVAGLLLLFGAAVKVSLAVAEMRGVLLAATGATTLFGNAGAIAAAKTKIFAAAAALMNRVLLRNPIILIVTLLATLVGAFIAMNGGVDGALKTLQPFFSFLQSAASSVLPALQSALSTAADVLGSIFGPVLGQLQGAFATLLPVLTAAGAQISTAFGSAIAQVVPMLTTLGTLIVGSILPALLQVAQSALPPLIAAFSRLAPVLASLVGSILMTAASLLSSLIPAITGILAAVIPVVATLVSQLIPVIAQVIAAVLPLVATLLNQLVPVFAQIVAAVVPVISTIVGELIPTIAGLISIIGPIVAALVGQLLPVFTDLVAAIMPLVSTLIGVLVPAIGQIITAVMPLISALISALVPAFQAVANIVTTVMSAIVPIIQAAVQIITGVINVLLGVLTGNWSQVWGGLTDIVMGVWNLIKGVILGAINIIVSIITNGLGLIRSLFSSVFGGLGGFISGVWNSIISGVTGFAASIGTGITTALTWFAQLPAKIGGFLLQLPGLMMKGAIALIQGFIYGLTFSIALVVLFFTVTLPQAITTAVSAVGTWLTTTGVDLLTGLVNGIVTGYQAVVAFFTALPGNVVAFVAGAAAWIVSAGEALLNGLVSGITAGYQAVVAFFVALPGNVLAFLAAAGSWLVSSGIAALQGLANGVTSGFAAVASFMAALPGRVIAFLAGAAAWLVSAGTSALQGLANGASSGFGAVASFLGSIPGRVTGALAGAASWLVSVGSNVMNGFINGVKAVAGRIADAVTAPIKGAISAAKNVLGIHSPSRVFHDIGQNVNKGLVNGLKTKVKNIKDAAARNAELIGQAFERGEIPERIAAVLFDANQRLANGLTPLARTAEKLVDRVADAQKKLKDLQKERNNYAKGIRDNILGAVDASQQASAAGYILNLQDQIKKTKELAKTLAALKKAGLDKGTYGELAQGGTDALPIAQSILSGGKKAIKQVSSLRNQLGSAAGSLSNAVADRMYDAGIQSAKGLVKGLQSQQNSIQRQMQRMADGMVRSIKRALDIHSPSRLMRDEVGAMIPAGISRGVQRNLKALTRNGTGMVQALMAGVAHKYPDLQAQLGGLSASVPASVQQIVQANVATTKSNTPTTAAPTNNTWNITTADDPVLWARAMGREYENLKVGS